MFAEYTKNGKEKAINKVEKIAAKYINIKQ